MKTVQFKKILSYLPEIFIIGVSAIWFVDNLPTVNYFVLAIIALTLVMMKWKVSALAFLLSLIVGLGSAYMIIAGFSEWQEMAAGSSAAWQLLLGVLLMFGGALVMSIIMPMKYLR
ncbi:MAG: hypothetical protein CSB02_01085 [Bacteroidia bacterium]|nr:MAG: hypothetical protein CSB02_01085 [Bacteroidia bacterium]